MAHRRDSGDVVRVCRSSALAPVGSYLTGVARQSMRDVTRRVLDFVPFDHRVALFRARLVPLPAQLLAPLRRHLPEPLKRIAHVLLLWRRQAPELLPALAQLLTLFRRHRTPLVESLLRARTLLRRHCEPAVTAGGERLLALGRQAIPVVAILLQHLLLLRRQGLPIVWCRGRCDSCTSCTGRVLGRGGLGKANLRRRQ